MVLPVPTHARAQAQAARVRCNQATGAVLGAVDVMSGGHLRSTCAAQLVQVSQVGGVGGVDMRHIRILPARN